MTKPNDSKIRYVYNKIAEGFYHLRQKPITPDIEKLAEKWKPGKILDIGCGTTNSLLPFAKKGFECHGIDISTNMIKLAKKYAEKHNVNIKLKPANMLKLPYKQEFDHVISIATLHHLDTNAKRLKSLKEIKRVLKKNGSFFFTVWNNPEKSEKDDYISWNHSGKQYLRYYHFFSISELESLLKKADIKANIYLDRLEKNICIESI
ncbi:MAG: class I SAM-dependent methyltransferase [Candidatus Aenigmatarchaeota archaeon]